MKHFSVFVLLAGTSVAGCAGGQSPSVPPMQESGSRAVAPNHSRSWMAPGTKRMNLLYVTNANNTVTVYSYPQGKLVGMLTGVNDPFGACADSSGNVYISDLSAGDVAKYAHGGTTPIARLKDPQYHPQGCAIDPTTGNLALANYDTAWEYPGNLSVYPKARGFAHPYIVEDFYYYWFAGYDGSGNLFVDGQFSRYGENFEFAELTKHGATLRELILPGNLGFPGGIAWDGTYLAVGDQSSPNIYEFSIAKHEATLHNTTTLGGAGQIGQFVIDGSTLVAPNQVSGGSNVAFYKYPAGGSPTQTITDGVVFPRAVAISKAASR